MSKLSLSNLSSRWQLLVNLIAIYIIWGSTYLVIRIAIQTIPPFFLGGIRFTVAGIVLYSWARLRGTPAPTWKNWRAAAIVGGLLMFIGNGGVAWVEQLVPSSITALCMATIPLWVVLLDWARPNGVRPGGVVLFGVLLGFVGMILLIGPGQLAGSGSVSLLGLAVLIVIPICWAVGSLYAHHAELPTSPALSSALEMLAGGAFLLITGVVSGEWQQFHPTSISPSSLLALSYLIIFGSFVAFTAFNWLLRYAPPSVASTYAYVNPVVAVFLGWGLAGEPLTFATLLSALTIVTSVAIITTYRTPKKSEAVAASTEEDEESEPSTVTST